MFTRVCSHNKIGIRRSALSLLFVALLVLGNVVTVNASVGAGGSFASTNYRVQPGNSLIDTGTDFNFVNNFDTTITVDFDFEAPTGVTIVLPSELVVLPARSTYRIPIEITTTASTQIGTFPLRIVGRVIPDSVNGVEVSGSAGLNASITVQGIARTTPPTFTLISRTQTGFTISITNNDPETVSTLFSLGVSPPITDRIDIAPQGSIEVTFVNLSPNTIYTVFATSSAAVPRDESTEVEFEVTTLSVPVEEPADDDDDETPTPPAPTPPAQPAPTPTPPASGGGGGSPVSINVLVIELDTDVINLNVFDPFTPPEMIAYVSIRDNVRETSRIDLTSRVVVTGQVNPDVVGRYELRYFLRYNTFTQEEIVVVNVRDTIAPRILSPVEITIKVDDPFLYELIVTDNYDSVDDLIITGFPSVVDTTTVGAQRFNVIAADQSGNRTPILFTVNVRERAVTPIAVQVNDVDIVLNAIEGLFDETNYRIEIAVAANQPLRNSPSWTLFTGQTVTQEANELVYVRVTDASGNTLIAAVDVTQGRVIPLDPDDNVISGDAWWRVLLRGSNVLLWIVPLLLVLGAWGWFFRFVAKRKTEYTVVFMDKGKVISEQRVAHGKSATPPNEGPWSLPFNKVKQDLTIERIKAVDVVKQPTPRKAVSDVVVDAPAKKTTRKRVVDETKVDPVLTEKPARKPKVAAVKAPSAEVAPLPDNEPVVQTASTSGTKEKPAVKKPRKPKDTVVAAISAQSAASTQDESLVQAASTTPAAKKPRRRRKAKEELYVQIVALEEDGVMDDDLLGAERLNLSQKTTKDVIEPLVEEVVVANQKVDERQIDLFDDEALTPPVTPKKK